MQISPQASVCPGCGAPLSIPEGAREVSCTYCQAVMRVDQTARDALETKRAVMRRVMLIAGIFVVFMGVAIIGSVMVRVWLQQRILTTVDNTQRGALREACRARCPGECVMREPRAKDHNACIDACQARCDKP